MLMFLVLLRFSRNKANASQFMDGHNAWLKDGFDKGFFHLAGTIQPKLGGAILGHNMAPEDLQQLVQEDPLVAEGVVSAEIIQITPSMASAQLGFLLEDRHGTKLA